MVSQDKLKELKKKLGIFKRISKKDSIKGKEKAKEIINLIDDISPDLKLNNLSMYKQLNFSKEALQMYINNLENMDDLKNKWD